MGQQALITLSYHLIINKEKETSRETFPRLTHRYTPDASQPLNRLVHGSHRRRDERQSTPEPFGATVTHHRMPPNTVVCRPVAWRLDIRLLIRCTPACDLISRRTSYRGAAQGVQLTGVQLTGVQLTGVQLTSVHLTGVQLIDVQLTGVQLTGVQLTGVHLTGVHLTDRRVPYKRISHRRASYRRAPHR